MRMPMTAGRPAVTAGNAGAAAASADASGNGTALIRRGGWRLGAMARQHWLISALLLAGLVLRVLADIAYRPALLYIDSLKYLYGAWPGNDPLGYNVVLKGLLLVGNLAMVVAVQHLLGLVMGLTLYLLLSRRGVPRWLAALAAAPVLLDGYQLQIEQTIMPDVWFEACIVAGLALLLWRSRPGPRLIVAGGLVLGLSAPFAQVGQILILPALLFVLIVVTGWRRKLILGAALCVAFAIPIAGFSMREYIVNGHFSLAPAAGNTIYGRLAESADCATLKLPSYERALCPSRALAIRLGPDGLVHNGASPDKTYVAPPGRTHAQMTDNFEHQVLGPAAAPGGGRHPERLGQAVRARPVHQHRGHADLPLAVPEQLPDLRRQHLPQPGRHHQGRAALRGQRRSHRAADAHPVLGWPGPGEPSAGHVPARLPAGRRLHPGAAAGPGHRVRPARQPVRAAPPPVGD